MNKATKQSTAWEPWDKVAIFSSCPQPYLIEEDKTTVMPST